jgi:hypothetical protein
MAQNTSRGYTSSARVSNEPGAYFEVLSSDFGVSGASVLTAPTLAASGTAGSLGSTTARAAITWITAVGESVPTAEATQAVTQSLQVTRPATPATGATVIGWAVYTSSGAAGSALRNIVPAAFSVGTMQTFSTSEGPVQGFPIATTTVTLGTYGTGVAEPQVDLSGVQQAMPSIPANASIDYFFRVPNSANRWRVQKSVEWMRPGGLAEPGGVVIGPADVINPVYPGTSFAITETATSATLGPVQTTYMALNGLLFAAIAGGTTAATFIGSAAFQNVARFATVTDGTVTWICLGRATLVRFHFGNTTASIIIPAVQEYDLFLA